MTVDIINCLPDGFYSFVSSIKPLYRFRTMFFYLPNEYVHEAARWYEISEYFWQNIICAKVCDILKKTDNIVFLKANINCLLSHTFLVYACIIMISLIGLKS